MRNTKTATCRPRCPLPNTHNRLHQAHLLWHQALDYYYDPQAFRANLNSTIEALRTITFMLQKEKHSIPDFNDWYEKWRDKMKADPVMVWLSQARTIVVHNSDLEILSTAHATIHNNLTLATITMQLPPLLSIPALCQLVSKNLPEPFSKNISELVLSIERRWIAKQLPDRELLEAMSHAYGFLSTLIKDAHKLAGFSFVTKSIRGHNCIETADGRLPCMITTLETRTTRINLIDGTPLIPIRDEIPPPNLKHIKRAIKRYEIQKFNTRLDKKGDPFEIGKRLVLFAKNVLRKDKYHIRLIFLRTPHGWIMNAIAARDRVEKYALMRALANTIHSLQADALIEIAEVWMSSFEELKKGHLPADAPNRQEALVVTVATSDGKYLTYVTPFHRTAFGDIKFDETQIVCESRPDYLSPVFEVWGCPLPVQKTYPSV